MTDNGKRLKVATVAIGDEPPERYNDYAVQAELLGFDMLCHADEKWTRDVYVRLTAAAMMTDRIGLATSVTDPFTRHPALTAQAAASLAEISEGRFRIMMGTGSHYESLPGFGIVKGPTAMREAVEVMQALWTGERITYEGEVISVTGAKFDFVPKHIPEVFLCARGPLGLKAAGRVADGALVGSFATKPGIDYARAQIEKGLDESSRTWDDFKFASWLYVAILDDESEPVPDDVRRGVSHALWSSRAFFRKQLGNIVGEVPSDLQDFLDNAPHEWTPEIMAELRALIPDQLFDDLAVVGTEEQVIAKLRALGDAGVDELVIWPFAREGEEIEDALFRIGRVIVPALGTPVEREPYRRID